MAFTFRHPGTIMALSVVIIACAHRPDAGDAPTPADSDVLMREELATVGATTQNAYSAVERLRPLFLTIRPGSATIHGTPLRMFVFINGSLAGDIDVLRTIPLESVESIRRVRATTAFTQYGEIHTGDGVILVRLRQ